MMGMSKRKNIFINSAVTDDDASLCLCLSLAGSASCRFPTHCETHLAKKRKLALQGNNICNVAAVVPVPVARRPRNWGYSTALVLYDDPWKIKKVLTQSDLGSNCNILIKRELAKDLIVPVLGGRQVCENQDVHVRVWDIDTNSLQSLVFTIRPSNQSHVFKDTWIK
ncbi:B3 domain-containing protein, partial [Trifolium medium]|nr:B3 domain-containing protein [Trifolium medium]